MGSPLLHATREQEPKPRRQGSANAPAAGGLEPAPRGPRPERALTHHFVRTVAEPGRYCDGQGLYLDVQPSGSRSWVQRLAVHGRRRELGLGSFPLVSLDEARGQALANRRLARAGGNPLGARRAAGEPTFAEAANQVWRQTAARLAQPPLWPRLARGADPGGLPRHRPRCRWGR